MPGVLFSKEPNARETKMEYETIEYEKKFSFFCENDEIFYYVILREYIKKMFNLIVLIIQTSCWIIHQNRRRNLPV